MVVWLITFFNHFHLSMSQGKNNKYLCLGVFGMWPLRQPLLTFHIWIVNLPQIAELFRGQLKNVMTAIFAHFFAPDLKEEEFFCRHWRWRRSEHLLSRCIDKHQLSQTFMRQRGSCEAGGGLLLIALLESLNIEAATLLLPA